MKISWRRRMLRRPSIIRAARRLSTQIPLPTPAICAVQLKPRANANAEVDQWLREGRTILAETLRQHRAKEAVPAARVVGPHGESPGPEWVQESCFHWVHLPSPEGSGHPETVAIVFSREEDLHRWRASRERVEWLATGAPHAADGAQLMVESKAVALQKDDGSLGGWLPDDGKVRNLPPPPTWKVAATVLLAMYPMQELNRTVTPPALSPPRDPAIPPPVAPHLARSPQITGAAAGARRVRRVVRAARRGAGDPQRAPAPRPPSTQPTSEHTAPLPRQLFLTCAWTCGTVSVVLLLPARAFVERVGFIGGDQGCPDGTALARGTALLVLAYAGLLGAGYLANEKLQTGARINRTLSEVRAR